MKVAILINRMVMNVGIALFMALIAGLSTGIGSLIALIYKKPNPRFLSFSLGLSAGVMIYVSFVELLPHGITILGNLMGIVSFFIGVFIILIIDQFFPEEKNPHHITNIIDQAEEHKKTSKESEESNKRRLKRTGIITAITIALHNFPEGLASFSTALHDVHLGLAIMIAIAIHNIPEGISVSVPIYFSTGNRKKAFYLSFLSGLSEPLAALIGALFMIPYLSDQLLGWMISIVAGIMVYISLDEILPTAHSCNDGNSHIVGYGVIFGMLIMAISLFLL